MHRSHHQGGRVSNVSDYTASCSDGVSKSFGNLGAHTRLHGVAFYKLHPQVMAAKSLLLQKRQSSVGSRLRARPCGVSEQRTATRPQPLTELTLRPWRWSTALRNVRELTPEYMTLYRTPPLSSTHSSLASGSSWFKSLFARNHPAGFLQHLHRRAGHIVSIGHDPPFHWNSNFPATPFCSLADSVQRKAGLMYEQYMLWGPVEG
jgi:hypothetical protein